MANSNISTLQWLTLLWEMTTSASGISTTGAAGRIGLKYDSTWRLMHKARRAMASANAAAYPMPGPVEIDEAFLGGPRPGVVGRGALGKELLLIIAGRKAQYGRLHIAWVPDAKEETLMPIIQEHVRAGAHIVTDGHLSYRNLPHYGYRHTYHSISTKKVKAHKVLPVVHSVASQFKRNWLHTWHGAVGLSQLQWYLDEFCFRYNRRHYKYRGRIFYDAVMAALDEPYRTGASVSKGG